jgi:CRP-like cAMP-binding protein
VRRREVLYRPGDAGDRIYVLERGVVKLSALRRDGLLALLPSGGIFGEEAILEDAPRDHMAAAYEDAIIGMITRREFLQMLHSRPELVFEVTKLVGGRLKNFRARVEHLLFKDVERPFLTLHP